jgi:hypothetical protein
MRGRLLHIEPLVAVGAVSEITLTMDPWLSQGLGTSYAVPLYRSVRLDSIYPTG